MNERERMLMVGLTAFVLGAALGIMGASLAAEAQLEERVAAIIAEMNDE